MRPTALALVAVAVLVTGGCATLTLAPDLTDGEAQSQTTALVDQVLADIDPSLVARVEQVEDESRTCYPPDVDSDLSILGWQNSRYIALTDDAIPLDVLNEIVAGFDESDWHISPVTSHLGDAAGGEVQISTADVAGQLRYDVKITATPKSNGPAVITVVATSPCYETK